MYIGAMILLQFSNCKLFHTLLGSELKQHKSPPWFRKQPPHLFEWAENVCQYPNEEFRTYSKRKEKKLDKFQGTRRACRLKKSGCMGSIRIYLFWWQQLQLAVEDVLACVIHPGFLWTTRVQCGLDQFHFDFHHDRETKFGGLNHSLDSFDFRKWKLGRKKRN